MDADAGNNLAPAELAERIRAGDARAETLLVQRYSKGLAIILRRFTRDPELSQDLLQDTLCLVLLKLRAGELENPMALPAFMRQVALNLAKAYYRKRKRQKTDADSETIERVSGESQTGFALLAREQTRGIVRQVIDELSVKRDRELLRRFYLGDEDKDVLCRDLDLSTEHFDRVLYRARNRLKDLLASQAGELTGRPGESLSSLLVLAAMCGFALGGFLT